ncbi:MAG: hypothetical protein ACI9WS_003495, partial [Paraglaciecola psychrophila]
MREPKTAVDGNRESQVSAAGTSRWPAFLTSLENPQYRWLFFGNFAF